MNPSVLNSKLSALSCQLKALGSQLSAMSRLSVAAAVLAISIPAAAQPPAQAQPPGALDPLVLPAPAAGTLVAITNANIMTASHGNVMNGTILIRNGKIAEVGTNVQVPPGAKVIDGRGKWITPGIIDAHSHTANEGINEGSQSITAEVRMHDVLRQDGISLYRQLAGGTTMVNILHGSANTIGGQNAVAKLKFGLEVDSLRFDAAPPGIKFALGENVRQTSRPEPTRYPRSRMGVEDVLRDAFTKAKEYQREWISGERDRYLALITRHHADAQRMYALEAIENPPRPPRGELSSRSLVAHQRSRARRRTLAHRSRSRPGWWRRSPPG